MFVFYRGCLGRGVYAGPAELALRFALKNSQSGKHDGTGAIVAVRFTAARPAYVDGDDTEWQAAGYDACCAAQTSCAQSIEWCVRDPERLTVIGIERVDVGVERDRFLSLLSAKYGGSAGADDQIFRCLREQRAKATAYWQNRVEESCRPLNKECARLKKALDASLAERAAEQALARLRNQLLAVEGVDLPWEDPAVIDSVCCPITGNVMQDPVILSDGHTYERAAIEEWLQRRAEQNNEPTSPLTNAVLEDTTMIPNIAMRKCAARFRESGYSAALSA